MVNPKVRAEISDNGKPNRRQPAATENPVGKRILSLLDGRDYGWLSEKTGVPASTLSDYVKRGISRADNAVRIARALNSSVEFLIDGREGGRQSAHLVDADDADWVELPEYAMMEFNETGKLEPITTALIRRDWLQASLGEAQGLWIARLPAPYDALALHRGEPIICTDHRSGDRMIDGTHYLFWVNGGIVMAPFARREGAPGERAVLARDIGRDEDQYQPVARVIGVLARPI